MTAYVTRRAAMAVPTFLGTSVLIFGLIHLIPGDLVTILMGVTAGQNEQSRAALVAALHLDRPLAIQYALWLRDIVVHGDLGRSLVTGLSVRDEILRSFPVTFELVGVATALALGLSIPGGVFTAARSGRAVDLVIRVTSLLFISVPAFLLGLLLIVFISRSVPWIPLLQYVPFSEQPGLNLSAIVPPALALGAPLFALFLRFTRSGLLDVLGQDYVRTARAKGAPERRVLYRHAMRNALIPILAVAGAQVVQLMGGLVVVETVFALPGVGRLLVEAVQHRDYTIVQGVLLVLVLFAVFVNIVLDLTYALLDPRISYG